MAGKLRPAHRARGFSLVEVLLAIFILGIGMIMVASVFPVGANWTRQVAEESVAQTVAQDAQTVIRRHYGVNGDLRAYLAPDYLSAPSTPNLLNRNLILRQGFGAASPLTPFNLQALPGFVPNVNTMGIPPSERAYQFGTNNPFPATDWRNCTYFWTAVARLNPMHRNPTGAPNDTTNGILLSTSYSYDIFILVFRKGAVENQFTNSAPATPPSYVEVAGLRDFTGTWNGSPALMPSIGYIGWSGGQHDPSKSPSVFNAIPPIGGYGIGATSGTVFRQIVDTSGSVDFSTPGAGGAVPLPQIIAVPAIEPVLFAPAADGNANSASPLIYVYQTTISF